MAVSPEDQIKIACDVVQTIKRSFLIPLVVAFGLWTFVAGYLAITVHEIYRDSCDVVDARPSWCDAIFPFDRNGPNPVQVTHNH